MRRLELFRKFQNQDEVRVQEMWIGLYSFGAIDSKNQAEKEARDNSAMQAAVVYMQACQDMDQCRACVTNLMVIGLSFRTWALNHDGQYPFNVPQSKGGSLEFRSQGDDGFDKNAAMHFAGHGK